MSKTIAINKIVYIGANYTHNGVKLSISAKRENNKIKIRKNRVLNIIEREGDISGCVGIFNMLQRNHTDNCEMTFTLIGKEILNLNKELSYIANSKSVVRSNETYENIKDCIIKQPYDSDKIQEIHEYILKECKEFLEATKEITEENKEDYYSFEMF